MSDSNYDRDGDESIGHAHVNSVDATVGQPLVLRVKARVDELAALRQSLPEEDLSTRNAIDVALATVAPMLTGDLEHVPPVVNADLSRWLERNKHVAETNRASDRVADSGADAASDSGPTETPPAA